MRARSGTVVTAVPGCLGLSAPGTRQEGTRRRGARAHAPRVIAPRPSPRDARTPARLFDSHPYCRALSGGMPAPTGQFSQGFLPGPGAPLPPQAGPSDTDTGDSHKRDGKGRRGEYQGNAARSVVGADRR